MATLDGTGILSGTGILDGRGMLFQSGIIVPPLVSLDPDAAAYIALVEAAGAAPDAAQKTVISDFYVAAKAEGYYTSLKRIYLPIWGVAAANAIDMIGGTSGTFVGGVTHGAGYVQGNGSTGYFNLGATYGGLGLTDTDCMQFAGLKAETGSSTMCLIGVAPDIGHCFDIQTQGNSGERLCSIRGLGNESTATPTGDHLGIFISVGNTGGGTRRLTRRATSGVDHYTGVSTYGAIPVETIHAMKLGAPDLFYHTGEMILWGVGTALSETLAATFSLHLKNLWEGCTGLTLP